MLARKRLFGGAVVGATSLLALVHGWRLSGSDPRPASVDEVTGAETPTPAALTTTALPANAPAREHEAEPVPQSPSFARSSSPVSTATSRRATRAARSHLRSRATDFGLDTRDVDALQHRDTYVGEDGVRIVRFRQVASGRPVLGREVSVVMNASGELAGITGRLAPSIALRRAELAGARPGRSAREAVSSLVGEDVKSLSASAGNGFEAFGTREASGRVRAVFFDRGDELVPAHQVELELRGDRTHEPRVSSVIVSAMDGKTLRLQSLVHADTFRVYADERAVTPHDSPVGSSAIPHPTGSPDGFAPAYVSSQLVTLENASFSRNDPWLPPSASSLSGNSVFAYVERGAPNAFDPDVDLSVVPTVPGVFDYTYDPGLSPTASDDQSRAAATQLFYTTSFLHDFFYDAGFDELAGNAQASNFGRGGLGGDRLIVAAQDRTLENRSVAIIPPDGSTPRLSFGIYKGEGGRPDRDGALDATLVAHEWGHLLAERLVGDGIGLGNPQGRAISEGTADVVALIVTIRPEDANVASNSNWNGVYAIGGYAASATDADAHYYGLRRVPYSTNLSKNALLFRHVARGAALPETAPMRPSDPLANALPHNAGEVWATALMDCYVSLLRAYPFQEAHDRMKGYLVRGLRAMPFEPTFTEAAAAMVVTASASDPTDAQRFSTALARRGLGRGADSPPRTSTDLVGIGESFMADSRTLRVRSITLDDAVQSCDGDGVLDVGEIGDLRVTIENVGFESMGSSFSAAVAANSASAALSFPNGNTLHFRSLAPGERATASIRVGLTNAGAGAMADVQITFDPWASVPGSSVQFRVPVHHDERPASATATMSTRTTSLAFERDGVRTPFAPTRDASDEFAHIEDGPARGTFALVTEPLQVTSSLGVSFRMRHSLRVDDALAPLDGAVVEISEDGIHFEDVTKGGANAGYAGALANEANNPIGARPAYTGMSAGFPAFSTRTIDLGDAYVGKSVVLRFRVGAAGSGRSAYGLDVDDLTVTGISGTPFTTRVDETSDGTVCNQPPVADAGEDFSIMQFDGDPALGVATVAKLSAANSVDPDNAALTYTWTQLSGPAVVLASDTSATTTFTAPAVAKDTMLVFRVAVSDGTDTTTDTVRVTVRHVNRVPTAVAEGPENVTAGATNVVLDGALSSDPDGDPLTYAWTQTSGPPVTLTTTGAIASFTAPVVDKDTPLAFSLVVSDGVASSEPSTVEVLVRPAPPPPQPKPDAGTRPSTPDAGADAGPSPSPSPSAPGNDDGDDDDGDDEGDDGIAGTGGDDGGCAMGGRQPTSTSAGFAASAVALGLLLKRRRERRGRLVE